MLSRVIDQAYFDFPVSNTLVSARALVLSLSIPHAGEWLHVMPPTALGLHLWDWEFCLCLQEWLGVKIL